MRLTITADQRDALYDQILDKLSGIGDVWLAASQEHFEVADQLGRQYSDDLRLVLDDLGWGEGDGRPIELTTPPDVLRRVFCRLRDNANGERASQEPTWTESRALEQRNQLVAEACQSVLRSLECE